MCWHHFSVASLILSSSIFPFISASQVSAQTRVPIAARCMSAITASGEQIWVSTSDMTFCSPPLAPVTMIDLGVDPEEHEFELFNNSYRDISFLHLVPLAAPSAEVMYGGSRRLAPGRAWSVNLTHGCDYDVTVEYEDGAQDFYEAVNTCDYRGLQIR